MPLQTKDGDHVARDEPAQECSEIFKKLLDRARSMREKHPIWADQDLDLSHDRATFFTAAEKPEGEGEVYHLIEQPPKSPDFHKVVEHPIRPIKAHFREAFTQLSGKLWQQRAMRLLEECVEESVKQFSIEKDVISLRRTLQSIISNGCDRADTGLR